MRQITVAIIICLFCAEYACSAFEDKPGSPEEVYSGMAYCANIFAGSKIAKNPAVCAFGQEWYIDAGHSELFGLKELENKNLRVMMPFGEGFAAGFNFESFGSNLYREQTAGLSAAAMIDENVSIGVRVKNNILKIRDYGSASFYSVDAGVAARILQKVSAGFCAGNIIGQAFSDDGEKPSKSFRAGIGIDSNRVSILFVDVEKRLYEKRLNYYFGHHFQIGNTAVVGTGYLTNPVRCSAGVSLVFGRMAVSYAFITHPYLGLEHHFGVSYLLKKGFAK